MSMSGAAALLSSSRGKDDAARRRANTPHLAERILEAKGPDLAQTNLSQSECLPIASRCADRFPRLKYQRRATPTVRGVGRTARVSWSFSRRPFYFSNIPRGLIGALQTHPEGCFVTACAVLGFSPTRLGAMLHAYLAIGGARSMRAWTEAAGIAPLDWAADIPNMNCPAGLAKLADAHG